MPTVNFDLNTYRTRFTGGARQYLFYVFLQFPATGEVYDPAATTGWQKWAYPAAKSVLTLYGFGASTDKWPYLVKTSTIPETTLDEIIIPWQHLDYKMAGQMRYGDWSVTFHLDEGYDLLKKLKEWQQMAHGPANYGTEYEKMTHYNVDGYKATQEIHLLSYSGDVVLSVKLVDAWPKIVGQVSYDYSSSEIATVDVTFAYTYQQLISKPPEAVTDALRRGYEKVVGLIRG